jgi:hypothetical protein
MGISVQPGDKIFPLRISETLFRRVREEAQIEGISVQFFIQMLLTGKVNSLKAERKLNAHRQRETAPSPRRGHSQARI